MGRMPSWDGRVTGSVVAGLAAAAMLTAFDAAAEAPRVVRPERSLAESLTGSAKRDFEAGRLLYGDGDFLNALAKMRSAWEASHDARLLWNAAACAKNLRRYAQARAYVRQYLAEATGLTEQERAEATELIQTLASFVAPLHVTGAEAGSTVLVDEDVLGTVPLAADAAVDMGKRRVRVVKDGFQDFEATVLADGERDVTVNVTQVRGSSSVAPRRSGGETTASSTGRYVGYSALGLGVASLGVGVVSYVVASGKHATAADHCSPELRLCDAEGKSADDALGTLNVVTVAGLGLGVVGVGVGSWLLLREPSDGATSAMRTGPAVVAGAPGWSVGGKW